tara:strand:+ start:934 stop:1257 length:324 start_codon:yes stop_codon:yes gene_type:complete
MNIITSLQNRISRRLTETKSPCKTYKTIAAAEKVADKLALEASAYFDGKYQDGQIKIEDVIPMQYVIFHIAELERYAIGFNQTEVMQRQNRCGGYLGVIANEGHYTF